MLCPGELIPGRRPRSPEPLDVRIRLLEVGRLLVNACSVARRELGPGSGPPGLTAHRPSGSRTAHRPRPRRRAPSRKASGAHISVPFVRRFSGGGGSFGQPPLAASLSSAVRRRITVAPRSPDSSFALEFEQLCLGQGGQPIHLANMRGLNALGRSTEHTRRERIACTPVTLASARRNPWRPPRRARAASPRTRCRRHPPAVCALASRRS